jgi:hypothetical protein
MAAYTVIDHTEVGSGGASSWSETGIPTDGTYDHLLILASIRSEQTGIKFDTIQMRVNGISSNVYTDTLLYAQTATPASAANTTARGDWTGAWWPAADMTANTFGCLRIWIPHYANTVNFKQVLMSSTGATATVTDNDWRNGVSAGLYAQTTAISSVEIASGYGADHAEFSTFTLYGVKGV